MPLATSVVQALHAEGIAALALGEVTQQVAEVLCAETAYEAVQSPTMDGEAGLALLFDRSRVVAGFLRNTTTSLRNREVSRVIEFELRATARTAPITMFVNHWPSRTVSEHAKLRVTIGSSLQALVNNRLDESEEGFVIVCGDFNDDPFDWSLTAGLFGTRDRGLAQRQLRALYNPFWRLLGERRPMEEPPHHGPGTAYWRGESETHWHTFDQFLFSSAFLRDCGWKLVESATEVWDRPPLAVGGGRINEQFDHYPVLATIRADLEE